MMEVNILFPNEAYDRGVKDHKEGKSYKENPYEYDDLYSAEMWENGWLDACPMSPQGRSEDSLGGCEHV